MAVLTDLPNELLLSIIDDVTPLHIDSFALSCKRIHYLCMSKIEEHDVVRSRLVGLRPRELLAAVVSDPGMALFPKSLKLDFTNGWNASKDLRAQLERQPLPSWHNKLLKSRSNKVIRLQLSLVEYLLNIRKIEFRVVCWSSFTGIISRAVKINHEPTLYPGEPLLFGRLAEANISYSNHHYCTVEPMDLAILFAMLPTLRKLKMSSMSIANQYYCWWQHRFGGVTRLVLEGSLDQDFLAHLINRTRALRSFTYGHDIKYHHGRLQPRLVVEHLKAVARQSLTFLSLVTGPEGHNGQHSGKWRRNHYDLSLGSLRDFTELKTLVTCVDMFIESRGIDGPEEATGTVQNLVSWLPASLEALVLRRGLDHWDEGTLRSLFHGIRSKKHERVPNLKLVTFPNCADFDTVMPDGVKAACREAGVKLRYTSHVCEHPDCRSVLEQMGDWDGLPWIATLGACWNAVGTMGGIEHRLGRGGWE